MLSHAYFRISVNSNNVQSLLDAANQYQIEPVKKMCVDFLKEQVDASNCLGKVAFITDGWFHRANGIFKEHSSAYF